MVEYDLRNEELSLASGRGALFLHRIKIGMTMIHESKIFELVQAQGTFSLEWVSEKGERVKADECQCTSFHSSGATMNVMLFPSKQIRKVNRKTIVAFNGVEVFI